MARCFGDNSFASFRQWYSDWHSTQGAAGILGTGLTISQLGFGAVTVAGAIGAGVLASKVTKGSTLPGHHYIDPGN